MVKVYANLIINGRKTLDDVPFKLREQVYQYLVEIGYIDAE
jgi:hypothetical protein